MPKRGETQPFRVVYRWEGATPHREAVSSLSRAADLAADVLRSGVLRQREVTVDVLEVVDGTDVLLRGGMRPADLPDLGENGDRWNDAAHVVTLLEQPAVVVDEQPAEVDAPITVTLDCGEQPQKQDVVVADASELGSSLPKIVVEIERIAADGGTLTITGGPLAGREAELLALAPALAAAHRSLVLPKLVAALGAAREQGRKGGRPKALDAAKLAQLAELVETGSSIADAATIMGVSRATAYRALAGTE